MGDNGQDLAQSVATMLQAGVISAESAMKIMGFVPPPLSVVRSSPIAIGNTVATGSGAAVIVRYDPERRRVHLLTSGGEELQIDERELLTLAPGRCLEWSKPVPTPAPEPQLVPVTVTRERSIMLD